MKITLGLINIVLILLAASPVYSAPPTDFELIRQNDHISLYERWITGKDGEKVRELKTILTIKSNVESIIHLLTDNQRGTIWNTNAVAYKVSHDPNRDGWVIYIQYGMPWPFNNQDCCLFYHLNLQTEAKTVLTFNSTVDQRYPLTAKADRLTGIRGEWILEKLNTNTVKVTYTITTDRSKKIPRWVSDPVVHNNLFNTMTSFKSLAENDR